MKLFGAAASSGLYGLSPVTQLIYVNESSGAMQPIGPALSEYAAGPALGAIDDRAAVLYSVMLSTASASAPPLLVGVRLSDGTVASAFPLPFANEGEVIMGHVALNTAVTPTVAIVGGMNARGEHVFGTVTAGGRGDDFVQVANLSSSWNEVGGCSTAFIPATNELLVQFDAAGGSGFQISVYAVSLGGNGSVRVLTEDLARGRDVQTLGGYDAVTGHVFALGFNASSGERELVDLDPVALALTVVAGNVSVDAVALNGMSALDGARRSLYWVGDRGGSDEFFLVETGVDDGAERSRTALCAYGSCPMTLAYYAGV